MIEDVNALDDMVLGIFSDRREDYLVQMGVCN